MSVILPNELIERIAQHERYARGVQGGRRLDVAIKTGCELDSCKKDLSSAEFVGAFLNHANFSYCKLRSMNFFGTTLNNSSFLQADLSQADLRGAVGMR